MPMRDDQMRFEGEVNTDLAKFKNVSIYELANKAALDATAPAANKATIELIDNSLKVVLPSGSHTLMNPDGTISSNLPDIFSKTESVYSTILSTHSYKYCNLNEFLAGSSSDPKIANTNASYDSVTKKYTFTNGQVIETANLISNPQTEFMIYIENTGLFTIEYSLVPGTWLIGLVNSPIVVPATSDFRIKLTASGSAELSSIGLFFGYLKNPQLSQQGGGSGPVGLVDATDVSVNSFDGKLAGATNAQEALNLVDNFDFAASNHSHLGTAINIQPITPNLDFTGQLAGKGVTNAQKLAEAVDGLVIDSISLERLSVNNLSNPDSYPTARYQLNSIKNFIISISNSTPFDTGNTKGFYLPNSTTIPHNSKLIVNIKSFVTANSVTSKAIKFYVFLGDIAKIENNSNQEFNVISSSEFYGKANLMSVSSTNFAWMKIYKRKFEFLMDKTDSLNPKWIMTSYVDKIVYDSYTSGGSPNNGQV